MWKSGFFRASAVLIAVGVGFGAQAQTVAQIRFGAQGPEGTPNRRQDWLVPTQDQITASHAVLFRPEGKGPFRIAIIAHASTQNKIRRAQMPQPEYRELAAALVARGFAVLVPERPGHGKTGGPYLEDQDGCNAPEYTLSGQATAEAITEALTFIRTQPFAKKDAAVIVGHSAGGWGALAMADRKDIASIIVFAPGRGGHADDRPNQVCAPDRLIAAAAAFGEDAKVPVTWLVAENDSYFSPELSRQMADAFRDAGDDKVDFKVLPPFGEEGHWLAETGEQKILEERLGLVLGLAAQTSGVQESSAKRKQ